MTENEISRLLDSAEIRAEALVALLRVLVGLGLAAFFVVTVLGTNEVNDAMLRRQWIYALGTMLAYILVGFIVWALIRHDLFHRRMVWPLAVIDVGFVVFSVRLGLMNTGLGGDMSFVMPAIWQVPLVLAFSVLRGNPQVFGATVVLLGLGLLYLLGLQGGPVPPVPQAIAFFLSEPPNLMRVAMVVLAGLVMIAAAHRTRRLLRRSIEDMQRHQNLTRYLPAQLARDLGATGLEALQRGRQARMGILFVDIRDFTRMSQEMTPGALIALVTDFRARVARVVHAHVGIVDKFIGDAVMVIFDGSDAPRHCLRCGLALQEELARWADARRRIGAAPVEAGVGMHWGEVFCGVVGDSDRLEYSVFGDTVNTAARLEALTRTLGMRVVASQDLTDAAGECGPLVPLDPVSVRGRDGVLAIYGLA